MPYKIELQKKMKYGSSMSGMVHTHIRAAPSFIINTELWSIGE